MDIKIRYLPLLTLFFVFNTVAAQINFFSPNTQKAALSQSDSMLLESLPVLSLPESLKSRDLPVSHDNSESPYLRPVFNQSGACCGQASGVAYNFTYEINRLRDLPSDDTTNQYPSHFTWNFMNGGNGYFGVSYLHSFDILKAGGNPNVTDYGGMDLTEGIRWMTGYDKYYNAMHNRIRGVSQIKVNTQEGLLTLKHYLENHLEGSAIGGVAGYYASSPYGYGYLPEDSPEAGKHVMYAYSGSSATHAMTIVGYHDSIRFDYNGDDQYTNDIDINGDGIVDMKDWEIGGLKFVNSYGNNWADSGFCYMMYKTLADNLGEGGIWNHSVHVLDAKATYEPKLTLKFTIKHDSRGKIKITAGVATDTNSLIPEHVMHFPFFNYQGGHHFMQGRRLNELDKFLEAGLDITPLLAFVEPGQPAKFFLQVTENDPLNEGTGRIIGLTLMDYNNGLIEIPCAEQDIALVEDGITRPGIVHNPVFDKVEIITAELPAITGNKNYTVQMEAQGGLEPYDWSLQTPWHQQQYNFEMPGIDDEQLYAEMPNQHFARKKIDFEFPFFGEKYDSIYIHENGFLMFEPDLYPWPYFNDPFLLFKKVKNISAFHFSTITYYNDPLRDEPEMWYEGNAYFAAFRWNGPLFYFDQYVGEGEFAVVLYPDGNIDFFYNNIQLDEEVVWYAGVSAGNEVDFTLLKNSNTTIIPEPSSFRLIPESAPEGLQISENGLLSGNVEPSEEIKNINIMVADDLGIRDSKFFQISDGLIFDYVVNTGDDGLLENGEMFSINLTVKNIFDETFQNVIAEFVSDDPYLELIATAADFGTLNPGESKTIEDAFTLKVSEDCQNQYGFLSDILFTTDEADWNGKMNFEAFAPSMHIESLKIQDDNNNRLDPGETVDVAVKVSNTGLLDVSNVVVSLASDHDMVTVNEPDLPCGIMMPGEEKVVTFQVSAAIEIPVAEVVNLGVTLHYSNNEQIDRSFQITIGQYTAVVFRKGFNPTSAEAILAAMNDLGVEVIYTSVLPEEFEMYRSVFVCLGGFLESNAITQEEAQSLVNYLNEGGNLYMEGTMTWTYDEQTSLHTKFNAGAAQISFTNFEQVAGIAGTFTEGMDFTFSGTNNFVPCVMNPEEPAYPIFTADGNEEMCIATANPAWNYKTIGAVTEFGSLGDEAHAEQRRDYLYAILDFFNLEDYVVGNPDPEKVVQTNPEISAYPNPFVQDATITISLEEVAKIDIDIYDLSGQHVRKLFAEIMHTGSHEITWGGFDDFGRQVSPGIYIYQVSSGNFTHTGKLIRMK